MGSRTTVVVFDDLDGFESDEVKPQRFALGDQRYEIDLRPDNLAALYRALEPYIKKARKLNTPPRQRKKAAPVPAPAPAPPPVPEPPTMPESRRTIAVRAWAEANGYDVKSHGRLPQDVLDAFQAAHATNGVSPGG